MATVGSQKIHRGLNFQGQHSSILFPQHATPTLYFTYVETQNPDQKVDFSQDHMSGSGSRMRTQVLCVPALGKATWFLHSSNGNDSDFLGLLSRLSEVNENT